MTLTPDEIAKRGFTPSADGYHQGEVREFLARIAAQHRALAASLPEGGPQVAELMLAVSNHETRLHQLEARLLTALEQLEETTRSLQSTQDRASQQLAASRKVTSDQRTMLDRLAPSASAAALQAAATARSSPAPAAAAAAPAAAKPTAAAPSKAPEPAAAKPAPATPAAAPAASAPSPSPTAPLTKPPVDRRPDRPTMAPPTPTTPPAPTPARTSAADAPSRAAAHMTTPAAPSAPRSSGGSLPDGVVGQRVLRSEPVGSTNPTRAAADEAASVAPPEVPTEELAQPSVAVTSISTAGSTPEPPLASPEQVLADFDRKPLIADNANDLLDGVLDDVMGNITERPDA